MINDYDSQANRPEFPLDRKIESSKENLVKVGIVQHSFSEDVISNRQRNLAAIESLAAEGAQLIVLSELHDSLYFCQCEDVDNFRYATRIEDFANFYSDAAAENNVVLVTSSFERRAPGLYHNTAIVFDSDGSIAGKYRKMHIPDSMKNSISRPATLDLCPSKLLSVASECLCAGINGIQRAHA